jgi:hypothetical protein
VKPGRNGTSEDKRSRCEVIADIQQVTLNEPNL